jgi:uncharacterized protein YjeT (DUF2065 family)
LRRFLGAAVTAAAFLRRFGAAFLAAGFAAAFLRRFGAAFLAAGFAAAFLRRFGAAFFAAAFLRRFGAAFFAAGLAAAFLRRFGAAFFAAAFLRRFGATAFTAAFLRRFGAADLAAAFLRRFGAVFFAAAMCLSPNRKGSDPSPKPVSWISVTEYRKKCHYIVRKIAVRVAINLFIFLCIYGKNVNYFQRLFIEKFPLLSEIFSKIGAELRIFRFFTIFAFSNGEFVRFDVVIPHFRQENCQKCDNKDA